MSMIKKILAAALAVLMLVAMTACGKECDYCGKSIKGEAVEGHYCTTRCALATKGCARCGGNIVEILESLEAQDRIDEATDPNLEEGRSYPERAAYIYEGKMYCSEDCAYQ